MTNSITLVGYRRSRDIVNPYVEAYLRLSASAADLSSSTTTMTNSITLVGRASSLEFREVKDGPALASFVLTTKPRGEQPPLVVHCQGTDTCIAEKFELMDEGCRVGIVGSLELPGDAEPLVRINRLEYLGKPVNQEMA